MSRALPEGAFFVWMNSMSVSLHSAVIVVNGDLPDPDQLRAAVAAADVVIAADGGAAHLHALGLRPHWLIGDFDSIDPAILESFQREGARVERHPPAKDATDLELALQLARRLGATQIRILAALGGRHDQALGNLLLLAQEDVVDLDLAVLNGKETLRVLRGPGQLTLIGQPGDTLSILPIGGDAVDVSLKGLAYPLDKARLPLGTSRGISNVLERHEAWITLGVGALLVVHTDR